MLRFVRILAFVLPGILAAATGTLTQTFEFHPNDFVFDKVNGYDVVCLPGQYSTTEPGKPNLPVATYNVAIPPDAEVTGIDVVSTSLVALPGKFNIYPSQHVYPLSKPLPVFVAPDPVAYAWTQPYPAELVRFTRSGVMGGFRLAGIQIAPLRYVAAEQRLDLATRVTVTVHFERYRYSVAALDASQIEMMRLHAEQIVVNPKQLAVWQPKPRMTYGWTCDMAVVTSSAMASSFQPFANWKTHRGINTIIVKTESIYSACTGRDEQEKIRNCVIDLWQSHGLKWLLVGGDDGIVPVRLCRLVVEGDTGDIATDMYYGDLQYSWDSNHNNVFGEMGDSVDLFYDIFVGRTPVNNTSDVATFFAKDTMFEKHQDTTCLKKVLYGSIMLWPPYHGRVINHLIANEFPSGWFQAHLEDPNSGVYADSMSAGFQLAHVAAHGNPNTFSVMDQTEVPNLTNGYTRLNFVNSIACETGWFDGQDCMAEDLVNATNGGCIACMFNSRYGFGYPPGFGPSEMLDLQFYKYFVHGYATQFGSIGQLAKDYYQSMAMGQEAWRWCVYELNLFGDPTLFVYSEKPKNLTVTASDSAVVGTQVLRVTVKNGATPLAGALVCLSKGTETYARGWTNSQGWIDLLVSPTTTGSLSLSASAQNFYPYDGKVPVRGSANLPALVFASLRIVGSHNGKLDPGDTASLYVSVANAGAASATGVTAKLRTTCSYLTLLDSTSSYGTIAAGDTVEGDAFRVVASPLCPSGTLAEMVAACTANEGSWDPFFETRIGDVPPAKRLWADHDTGNMILSVTAVGSIGTLGPYKEGSGLKYPRNASNGSLYFTSFACGNGPDYVVDRWYGHPSDTFETDWRTLDSIQPVIPPIAGDEEYQAMIDDGGHPTPKGLTATQWSISMAEPAYRDFVVVVYKLENRGGQAIDGLYTGIFSDFDVNNTTDNNVYSDVSRRLTYMTQDSSYENSAGIKLLSPTAAANLSAIDNAVYVDPSGMLTEAVKDSFLRGAISIPNSDGSRNWSCVVSAGPFDLPVNGRAYVAFAFVGGNSQQEMLDHADSAQAWFDRSVAVAEPVNIGAVSIARVALDAEPSPVRDRAQLHMALPLAGRALVEVLDVEGRVVRVLANAEFPRGVHTFSWDGRDQAGHSVAGGVYLYRLVTAAGTVTRKAVVLR